MFFYIIIINILFKKKKNLFLKREIQILFAKKHQNQNNKKTLYKIKITNEKKKIKKNKKTINKRIKFFKKIKSILK